MSSKGRYADLDPSDDEETKTDASDASEESDSSEDERSRGSQSTDFVDRGYLRKTTSTKHLTFFGEASISDLARGGPVTLTGSLSDEPRPAIITRVAVVGLQTDGDIVLGYSFPWLHEKQPLKLGEKQFSLISTNILALPQLVFEASSVSRKSLKHVKKQTKSSASSSSGATVKPPSTLVQLGTAHIEFLQSRNRPIPSDGYVPRGTFLALEAEMSTKDDVKQDISSLTVVVENLTTESTKELGEIEKTIPIVISVEISYVC